MAAVETPSTPTTPDALPGLGRALVSAGKIGQKAAEDLYKKAVSSQSSFIAELTSSGAVSASDLAHHMSLAFAAPLLDLDAIDPTRLPKDLLDSKICQAYRVVVLSKRGNRLIVATADPSDKDAIEKIKFSTQMGVDWVIAEYDKISRLIDSGNKSNGSSSDEILGDDFEFGEIDETSPSEDN